MDKIVRKLLSVENVGKRLKALSDARGIPANIEQQTLEESEAILWAYRELRHRYLVDVMIIVGNSSFVRSVDNIDEDKISNHDDISVFLWFEPDKIFFDSTREYLAPGWKGNKMPENKMPVNLFCHRYFASCGNADTPEKEKAILFDCSVAKSWLEEAGRHTVKSMLTPWAIGVFKAMPWEKAHHPDHPE
jgi:hypothetical protein